MRDLSDAVQSSPPAESATVDEVLCHYTMSVHRTLDQHAPLVNRRGRHWKHCPWYDEMVHRMLAEETAEKDLFTCPQAHVPNPAISLIISYLMSRSRFLSINNYSNLLSATDEKTSFRALNNLLKFLTVALPDSYSTQKLSDDFAVFLSQVQKRPILDPVLSVMI